MKTLIAIMLACACMACDKKDAPELGWTDGIIVGNEPTQLGMQLTVPSGIEITLNDVDGNRLGTYTKADAEEIVNSLELLRAYGVRLENTETVRYVDPILAKWRKRLEEMK